MALAVGSKRIMTMPANISSATFFNKNFTNSLKFLSLICYIFVRFFNF